MPKITHKFEAGQSYGVRSAVDADTVIGIKIERRTATNVWIKISGKLVRRGVRVDTDGVERFDPYGRYSMSPVIAADRTLHDLLTGKDKQPPAAPTLRPYQQETLDAINSINAFFVHKSELVPQRTTGRAVAALKASAADIALATVDELEHNRFDHATRFVARFMTATGSQQVDREHVRAFLHIVSRMTDADFDDLDLIRQYLRGE